MKLSKMFKKPNQKKYTTLMKGSDTSPEIPEGLWKKCNACKAPIMEEEVRKGDYICPKCGHYFRISAYERIKMIADSFEEWDKGLTSGNPLGYKGYEEKLESLRIKTELDEAVVTGKASIDGRETVLAVMDGRFMMASMGKVVGEKITRAVERATKEKLPVIIFCCSGGARMQEGIHSLMQMSKTSAALKRHHEAGQLYVSVLTDPTTGGVTASFAMLGDIILAEPGALIGFAGPRVIEQTIGQKLPEGFQRAEFLLDHGFVDRIVERKDLKKTLSTILRLHVAGCGQGTNESGKPERKYQKAYGVKGMESGKYSEGSVGLSAWDRVMISRLKDRPVGTDYISSMFTDFVEFHGDRYFKDDKAIVGGIATFHGQPVTVIAQTKGKNTKENIERNYGMPSPDGYRKALRLMKQAEKFRRPVICFVDTPGAFCGIEAEERGQGEAIARNLFEMSGLKVPVVSIIIGEGGSGGALAMAVADEVWMLRNSVYSILSPEGFASILWKDAGRAKEAAEVMKLTAGDLKEAGIIECVFEEPEEFSVQNLGVVTRRIEVEIERFLKQYGELEEEELLEKRYERFRNM